MMDPVSGDQLARYLAGDATPDEEALVRSWLERDPAGRIELEGIRVDDPGLADRRNSQRAYHQIMVRAAEVQHGRQFAGDRAPLPRPRRRLGAGIRYGVLLLLLAASGLWIYQSVFRSEGGGTVQYVTGPTQQRLVTLPDGSTVLLNSGSRLTVESGSEREVTFSGEAFFDVRPDPRHPFVVHTDDLNVRVLGTAFNLDSGERRTGGTLMLVRGKVELVGSRDRHHRQVVDRPGTEATYDPRSATPFTLARVDTGAVLAWRTGTFRFVGEPLADAAAYLAGRYDAEIRIAPGLEALRIDGSFDVTQPLSSVLQTITVALDLRWRQDGTRYLLYRPY